MKKKKKQYGGRAKAVEARKASAKKKKLRLIIWFAVFLIGLAVIFIIDYRVTKREILPEEKTIEEFSEQSQKDIDK